MRFLSFLFLIIVFASCDHPKKPYIEELTWPKRTVKLDNDLGVLTIRLPEEFDTTYFRLYYSDLICGEYQLKEFYKNGFRPSPVEYADGISWQIDSILSFSVLRLVTNCQNERIIDTMHLNYITSFYAHSQLANNKNVYDYEIKTLEEINSKNFLILGYNGIREMHLADSSKSQVQTLEAITSVKGELIRLTFNCATSNCDSFIPKMYKALKTVQIKPN